MEEYMKLALEKRRIDSLPLLLHYIERLNLREVFSSHISHTRYVDALIVILTNILYGSQAMYRLKEWSTRFEASLLPEDIGADDAFGRALDALFKADRAAICTELITTMISEWSIKTNQIHADTTSVSFYGRYLKQRNQGVSITHGHSKDHRPDLKQIIFKLCISADGATPLFHRIDNGNTEDSSMHCSTWDSLVTLLGKTDFFYVADSKLCVKETMAHIHQGGGKFVTVVPKIRKEFKEFNAEQLRGAVMWEYLTKKKRGDHYEQIFIAAGYYQLAEGFRVCWYRSSDKQIRDKERRTQRIVKTNAELEELIQKPGRGRSSKESLEKKAQKILTKNNVADLYKIEVIAEEREVPVATTRGRPTKDTTYKLRVKTEYQLRYRLLPEAVAARECMDGVFPLVSNACNDPKEIYQMYKWQPNLEKRFAILKSGLQIAPMFLKKNTRIESLTLMYFLAELIISLIERDVSKEMKKSGLETLEILPEQRKSPKPTWEQIRRQFEDHCVYDLYEKGTHKQRFSDELSDIQKKVIEFLGVNEELFQ
jgi:transposase